MHTNEAGLSGLSGSSGLSGLFSKILDEAGNDSAGLSGLRID
jgi:hypothetical protein